MRTAASVFVAVCDGKCAMFSAVRSGRGIGSGGAVRRSAKLCLGWFVITPIKGRGREGGCTASYKELFFRRA